MVLEHGRVAGARENNVHGGAKGCPGIIAFQRALDLTGHCAGRVHHGDSVACDGGDRPVQERVVRAGEHERVHAAIDGRSKEHLERRLHLGAVFCSEFDRRCEAGTDHPDDLNAARVTIYHAGEQFTLERGCRRQHANDAGA